MASVASEILVSIVRCLFRIAPLLLAGLFMAGCAPSHYSKGISSFAAAAPVLDKVDASYTAVNDVHRRNSERPGLRIRPLSFGRGVMW